MQGTLIEKKLLRLVQGILYQSCTSTEHRLHKDADPGALHYIYKT